MLDSLKPAMNVLISTNVVMFPIHVLKMLHMITILFHTHANVRLVITVTHWNA